MGLCGATPPTALRGAAEGVAQPRGYYEQRAPASEAPRQAGRRNRSVYQIPQKHGFASGKPQTYPMSKNPEGNNGYRSHRYINI